MFYSEAQTIPDSFCMADLQALGPYVLTTALSSLGVLSAASVMARAQFYTQVKSWRLGVGIGV
jgi:hypothetical protein